MHYNLWKCVYLNERKKNPVYIICWLSDFEWEALCNCGTVLHPRGHCSFTLESVRTGIEWFNILYGYITNPNFKIEISSNL